MRILIIILICLAGISFSAEARPSSVVVTSNAVVKDPLPAKSKYFANILSMKVKEVEKLIGRKLSLKEKISFKLSQWKLKKFMTGNEPTEHQKKQANWSMILGITSIVLLFIPYLALLALPAAVAAIILGIVSLKGNSNTKGIIGLATGGTTILLFIIALVVIAAFLSSF